MDEANDKIAKDWKRIQGGIKKQVYFFLFCKIFIKFVNFVNFVLDNLKL